MYSTVQYIHCPQSNLNFRDIAWNVEVNEILYEIFRVVSRFPHNISCYIAELPLGQCIQVCRDEGLGDVDWEQWECHFFSQVGKNFMRKWMVNCSLWRVIAGYNLRLSRFFNTWVSGYIFVRYILLCTSPEWYCTLHCKCNKNIANLYCRDLVHPYHLNTWSWKWALILKLKTYYFFLYWNIFCQYCTVTLGIIFISKYFLITTFSFLSQAVLDLIKVYSKCIL